MILHGQIFKGSQVELEYKEGGHLSGNSVGGAGPGKKNGQDSHRWGEMRTTGLGDNWSKLKEGNTGQRETPFWLLSSKRKECGQLELKNGVQEFPSWLSG